MPGRRTVGIDLGTSHSAVAVIGDSGEPALVPIPSGGAWVPSVVAVTGRADEPELLVGARALRAATARPDHAVTAFKRLIGRRFADDEIQRLAPMLPYRVVAAPNGDAWAQAGGVALSPPFLSALVLRELVGAAEAARGEPVTGAVITVPARFDIEQRRATRDAAEIAGLAVRRLINEPTAAALGVGAHRGEDQRLAVCDLGAGTFDVSIVNVEHGVIEVLASAGDSFLGGEDVDRVLLERLIDEIGQEHGLDAASDLPSLQRLRDECRAAKHRLSQAGRAEIALVLAIGGAAPLEYRRTVRRDELELWMESTLNLLQPPCLEVAARCGLRPTEVNAVILVGGSARIPAVQRMIAGVFGRAPRVIGQRDVVALGAATLAALLDGATEEVAVLDVTARAIGVNLGDGRYQQVIARNTAVPTREHKVVATTRPDQLELELDVYEGESPSMADNRLLGRYVCSGLPPGPAGHVMVALDFTVNVDGLLRVSASEMGRGVRPELRLRATAGLTRAHVQRLRASLAAV